NSSTAAARVADVDTSHAASTARPTVHQPPPPLRHALFGSAATMRYLRDRASWEHPHRQRRRAFQLGHLAAPYLATARSASLYPRRQAHKPKASARVRRGGYAAVAAKWRPT